MGTFEISVLALRLAALYVWIQVILQITSLPMILTMSEEVLGRASTIGYAITMVLHALLGTALWFGSRPLARRMFGEPSVKDLPRAAAIAGLGFVLAGILAIDLALGHTWDVIFSYRFSSVAHSSSRFWAASASLAMLLILGVALLLGSRKIAMRMFPPGDPARPLTLEIQSVAFSVLGIVITVRAIQVLLSIAATADWFSGNGSIPEARVDFWLKLAAEILRLAIGVGLFLGGGALSRLWRWTQTAGLDRGRAPSP